MMKVDPSDKKTLKTAPAPILGSLEIIGNPHRRKSFRVDAFFDGAPVRNAEADYEAVVKFLSYNGLQNTG